MNTYVWIGLAIFAAGFIVRLIYGLRYKKLADTPSGISDTASRRLNRIIRAARIASWIGITIAIIAI